MAAVEALPGLEGGKGGADAPLVEPAVREVGAQGAASVLGYVVGGPARHVFFFCLHLLIKIN